MSRLQAIPALVGAVDTVVGWFRPKASAEPDTAEARARQRQATAAGEAARREGKIAGKKKRA